MRERGWEAVVVVELLRDADATVVPQANNIGEKEAAVLLQLQPTVIHCIGLVA